MNARKAPLARHDCNKDNNVRLLLDTGIREGSVGSVTYGI
jgi:hypothetical protein